MVELPPSIVITIAVLTLFFCFVTGAKYAIENEFSRTRLIMSAFFIFIVTTLTICFSQFFFETLPFTIPAGAAGVLAGWMFGVRTAEQRLHTEGIRYYMEHFAHIHPEEINLLNWWTIINFYTVMSALLLINLVGLTTVLLHNLKPMALLTSAVGAFLIGSIIPYLIHLWSIRAPQNTKSTTSE